MKEFDFSYEESIIKEMLKYPESFDECGLRDVEKSLKMYRMFDEMLNEAFFVEDDRFHLLVSGGKSATRLGGHSCPKWLYRLESTDPNNGLWYDQNNNLVWGIGKLENCKTKDLPMDYDERYHKEEKNWFSSCSNKEDLAHWYSLQDAKDLITNGFVFTRYLATEYIEYKNETTFLKETCLEREELNIEDIWVGGN